MPQIGLELNPGGFSRYGRCAPPNKDTEKCFLRPISECPEADLRYPRGHNRIQDDLFFDEELISG